MREVNPLPVTTVLLAMAKPEEKWAADRVPGIGAGQRVDLGKAVIGAGLPRAPAGSRRRRGGLADCWEGAILQSLLREEKEELKLSFPVISHTFVF